MKIVIDNIKMPIGHTKDDVIAAARGIVRSDCVSAKDFEIYKQSLDARRKNNIHYVYSVAAKVSEKEGLSLCEKIKDVRFAKETEELLVPLKPLKKRPIVIGLGPCGLFAAWVLTVSGNPPLIIERGEEAGLRKKSVEDFWKTGVLNENSNVQFGEGGAGAFSDGKLTTRIGDGRQRFVLRTLVDFGAPKEILYKAKPHIGTDLLRGIITSMRKKMEEMGAEVRFNTRLTDIGIKNGKVVEVTAGGETIPCDNLILAIGHSSRDTYKMLVDGGISALPKPFAMGVRIEHKQEYISCLQYGIGAKDFNLPAADYRVVYDGEPQGLRSCYSFCMCPGGTVVNASSERGRLAVNGMSYHARNGENANSALVVPVRPEDFGGEVLGGMYLQQKYEELAYKEGGNTGVAPVQLAEDFIKDIRSTNLKGVTPTVTSGFKFGEIKNCLPGFVADTLKGGLLNFERRMPGFSSNGAVLVGIESRTSAPLRLVRDDSLQSIGAKGLYPSGEGAGYAGGIVSAAVDGIKSALATLDE